MDLSGKAACRKGKRCGIDNEANNKTQGGCMKVIARTAVSLVLLISAFAGLAQAQYGQVITVNVPFEFTVGHKTFPAGSYSIVRTAPCALALRDSRAYVLATVMTTRAEAATPSATAKLVFRVEGGRHVLDRVWSANSRFGDQLPRTKPGIDLARAQATKASAAGQP
jgi:hypothetical protein